MRISLPKLKAIILYFCENTEPKFLGKVKLMKLFYFMDFTHVKLYGSPITFDRYVKLEHGPIPSIIKSLVDDAGEDIESSALADTIDIVRVERINMMRVVPRRKFTNEDKNLFSENELFVLDKVCARFTDSNTSMIENASHEEAPWTMTNPLEEIPYTLAAKDADCRVTQEDIELSLKVLGN
jgi:uncharacterized phage-associated protein